MPIGIQEKTLLIDERDDGVPERLGSAWLLTLAVCLFFLAVVSSAIMSGTSPAIGIRRPWVLLILSLTCMINVSERRVIVLQKLLTTYFICMLISQLTLESMTIGNQVMRLILPKSLIPGVLYTSSLLLMILSQEVCKERKDNVLLYVLWAIGAAMLALHMVVLWIPLKSIYGFGYELNVRVLGDVGLYTICFFCSWRLSGRFYVRSLVSGCIAVYLFLLQVAGELR